MDVVIQITKPPMVGRSLPHGEEITCIGQVYRPGGKNMTVDCLDFILMMKLNIGMIERL